MRFHLAFLALAASSPGGVAAASDLGAAASANDDHLASADSSRPNDSEPIGECIHIYSVVHEFVVLLSFRAELVLALQAAACAANATALEASAGGNRSHPIWDCAMSRLLLCACALSSASRPICR